MRIIKRSALPPARQMLLRLSAAAAALVFTGILLAVAGYNPLEVYSKLLEGALASSHRIVQTVNKAVPLALLSLGVAVAFKMKFWNIGAEGQLYMGAFGAAFAVRMFGSAPAALMLVLMFVCAVAFSGAWALIPAVLKVKFGANETLVTLMLNYIAVMWISYLQYGPWRDPSAMGFPKIAAFPKSAVLPSFRGFHAGVLILAVAAVFVWLLIEKSKPGYEISVLGESKTTAAYAGMNTVKITLTALFISGALCGTAGMVQASAIEKTLNDKLSGGLGFTAVITAWLAKLSPPAMIVVSFLFAVLLQGGVYLQTAMNLSASVAEVIQAVIIFFVLGSEFFIEYKIVGTKKGGDAS